MVVGDAAKIEGTDVINREEQALAYLRAQPASIESLTLTLTLTLTDGPTLTICST